MKTQTEIYHTGSLGIDRAGDPALDQRATALLEQSRLGVAYLFQRRVGFNSFQYLAYSPKPEEILKGVSRV